MPAVRVSGMEEDGSAAPPHGDPEGPPGQLQLPRAPTLAR